MTSFMNSPLIHWLNRTSFSSKSLKHHKSQTVRARELKFETMFTSYHVSHVRYQVSHVIFLWTKWLGSRWRVCYQRGLPRLVFIDSYVTTTTNKWTLIPLCTLQASCSHAAGQAEIQPLVWNHTSSIEKCPINFWKSQVLFFWYEPDPKLKLFWKGNAMTFKIGGVNIVFFGFS